jgi:hypothetical protein
MNVFFNFREGEMGLHADALDGEIEVVEIALSAPRGYVNAHKTRGRERAPAMRVMTPPSTKIAPAMGNHW